MYELLKGRNTVKNRYATYSDYEVKLNYGGTEIVLLVDALNEYDARKVAAEKLIKSMTATITKV
jgi:hypothetical protein